MNHFVLHDDSDCMAVVVVDGVSTQCGQSDATIGGGANPTKGNIARGTRREALRQRARAEGLEVADALVARWRGPLPHGPQAVS